MGLNLSPSPRKYRLENDDTQSEPYDSWEQAAQHAVDAGVGRWEDNGHVFKLDWPWQIKAVRTE